MSNYKVGDKVWVLCKVIDPCESLMKVTGSGDENWFWAGRKQCRPVEPPVIEACTETANDQLRQSLMDYPFGEPSVIKDCLTTESNCPEIPDSSSEPLAVGDAVIIVERSHKWRGVRGRIVSVSESNEYPLEFISDCGKRLGYFRSSSVRKKNKADPINPSHYKQGGIECIEAIKAATGDGFIGYVWGNVLKYLWRWPKKGGIDDLKKARWYLDRLITEAGE